MAGRGKTNKRVDVEFQNGQRWLNAWVLKVDSANRAFLVCREPDENNWDREGPYMAQTAWVDESRVSLHGSEE